ncbi:MAG: AraC family transcriptional regulator [Proteobacteria bacterium]|nr:AraC family transcriptional regulator [Pseudomonadota bacterium]
MSGSRTRGPELEHDFVRDSNLGYEPEGTYGYVRCLEHGFPNPLVRWHYHEEYELHLIVQTRGKVFVGDYIGHFEPGHLVLTGPRLPHNWISADVPSEGVALRDMVLQFSDEPLRRASELIPDLRDVLPLLERARLGIEFFGISERARTRIDRIKSLHGLKRFAEFLEFLGELADCTDYRLLSSMPLQSFDDDTSLAQISGIVDYITENCTQPFSMAELSKRVGMSESQFSRYFRRATGNTFTDFVNRLRITRACQLLMDTDRYITNVCYDSGFNNVANFNRRFLEIKGMTPKEFRRQGEARFGARSG